MSKKLTAALIATGVIGSLQVDSALAQSTDSLLNKLVDKGVITKAEADELRKESKTDFDKAYQVKSGMPDWVTSLKFGGDFRGRYDGIYPDSEAFVDRPRYRYRLRYGAVATMLDNIEVGFRLTSASPTGDFGGNPLSGNSTLENNGSKKWVWIDQAYGKFTPFHSSEFTGSFTFGKMENPFTYSEMVFDADYSPEGLASQFTFKPADAHALKLSLGAFSLDEISGSSHDPYMLGANLRLESKWTETLQTTLGVGGFVIGHEEQLGGNVPNLNHGNTVLANTAPAVNFNPIVVDASVTYTVDSVPGYAGHFPIRIGGEYMNNLAISDREQGFSGGIRFGRAGKKGLWELGYDYRYLGANAWYEEVVHDDFGAIYNAAQPNSGIGAGYGSGTNVKGHIVRAAFSPYDAITLSVTYFRTDLIEKFGAGGSGAHRILADILFRF